MDEALESLIRCRAIIDLYEFHFSKKGTPYLTFEVHTHNKFMNVGLDSWVSALAGVDTRTRYMGVGTSNAADDVAKTQLVAEIGRVPIANQVKGSTGRYQTRAYFGPTECNGTWEECGWFCGTGATATANSGVMLGRTLFHYVKAAGTGVTVVRTDILENKA